MKYKVECTNRLQHVRDTAKEIKTYYKNNGKSDLIILNIGSSAVIEDSVAPLVGSMLKNKSLNMKIYGNLDEQITISNIADYIHYIKKYSDAFIIVVKSSECSKDDIGTVKIKPSTSFQFGNNITDIETSIGDIIISATTSDTKSKLLSKTIDIKIIYKMAEDIADIITKLDYKIKRSKRKCSRKSLA